MQHTTVPDQGHIWAPSAAAGPQAMQAPRAASSHEQRLGERKWHPPRDTLPDADAVDGRPYEGMPYPLHPKAKPGQPSCSVSSPGRAPRGGAAAPARSGGRWLTGGRLGHQAADPRCPQTAAGICKNAHGHEGLCSWDTAAACSLEVWSQMCQNAASPCRLERQKSVIEITQFSGLCRCCSVL